MKRVLQVLPILAILTTASVFSSKAQVSVSVNIGAQPQWGPAGYASVDYYYLPDIECYYYVPRRQFVYMSGPNWVFSYDLPSRYRGYDLYGGYKVVINEPKPYLQFATHKVKYGNYKGAKGKQVVIRDSKDPKYFVVKGHPGNAKGHYKQSGGGNNGNSGNHGGNKGQGHGHGGGKGKKG
jgi:hypothetical protein